MKSRGWLRTALVLAGLWAVVLTLFRGSAEYGMNYDEVLRLAPFVQFFEPEAVPVDQALYRIQIGSLSIPVMVKSYISSIAPLPLVPALFFDRQPEGLRRLELLLFLVSVSTLFLVLRRHDFALAAASSLLLATGPHFYPEVRYGFAGALHVVCLAAAAVCLRQGMARPLAPAPWFLAGLFLGLAVNVHFYALWTIAGGVFALAAVFPAESWRIVRRPRRALALLAGILVGGANYVVYNVATAGASLRPMVLGLVDRDAYNERPIDYLALPDFPTELRDKLENLGVTLGDDRIRWASALVALVVVAALVAVGVAVRRSRSAGQWTVERRLYCLAPVAFVVTVAAILVTPKSGRAGHWVYVSPYFELTLVGAALLAARVLPWRTPATRRGLALGALGVVAVLFVGISNAAVVHANETKGTHMFSAAIYDIHAELTRPGRPPFSAMTVDWGLWSQLYFLSSGRLPVSERAFALAGQPYVAVGDALAIEITANREASKDVLFLYHQVDVLPGAAQGFRRFVAETGADLEIQSFSGQLRGDRHFVARLRNSGAVLEAWRRQRGWGAGPPIVVDYGPRTAQAGRPFSRQPGGASAMWLRLDRDAGPVDVAFGPRRRRGTWSAAHRVVTAVIDPSELSEPGIRPVRVCYAIGGACSEPVELQLLPPV